MISVDIEPNQEEKLEKLSQDFDSPFSPPTDIKELIPKDYPSLDDGVDVDEWYNSGATIASLSYLTRSSPTVLGYTRPNLI